MKILNRDKGPWAFAQVVKGWWGLGCWLFIRLEPYFIWKRKKGGNKKKNDIIYFVLKWWYLIEFYENMMCLFRCIAKYNGILFIHGRLCAFFIFTNSFMIE